MMTRNRKNKDPVIKLAQPDRSAPSEKTLLHLAEKEGLFAQAAAREKEIRKGRAADDDDSDDGSGEGDTADGEDGLPPWVERLLESVLWAMSISMLHFTLDVLVQRQFGMSIEWMSIFHRTGVALVVFLVLIHVLHPHPSSPHLLPSSLLPTRYHAALRQTIFFVVGTAAGCRLIYISNEFEYLNMMKRAPTLGCLWLWSTLEMDLIWATASLSVAVGYLWWGGYGVR